MTDRLHCLDTETADALSATCMDDEDAVSVAAAAHGLADETRVHLATVLAEGGEVCVGDLARVVNRPSNLVSHHVRQLRQAGLATQRRDGKLVKYRLTELGVSLLDALTDTPGQEAVA